MADAVAPDEVTCYIFIVRPELILPSWGSSNTQRPHMDGIKIVLIRLNDETFGIERDLNAFGPVGGSAPAPI